jgi:hypothetical protein
LIAEINKRRPSVAARLIDPGTKAAQGDARGTADRGFPIQESSPTAL